MSEASRTTRNLTSNWLMLTVGITISFFLSPYIVNKLGSVYYGIWAIAMQFTGYLYLMDFGVRESVIRYTSKYAAREQTGQLNKILSTAMLLYAPITAGCLVLTGICAWLLPNWFDIPASHATEARLAVVFTGMTIAQTFLFNVYIGVLQGLKRFDVANAIGLVISFIRAGLIVAALAAGYKLVGLAVIQFVIGLMGGICGAIAARRLLRKNGMALHLTMPARRTAMALGRRIFGYGFYVLMNNVAQKINFATDAIVIGIFLPVSWVTPYAIAGSLVDYLRSFIISTAQIFNPMSSELHTLRRKEELGQLLIRGAKLAVAATLPVAIVYAALGDIFIGLWMGEQYRESAGQVLLILGLMQIISAPHYVVSSVLYGMSQHHTIAWLRVGEATANLLLSILLVQSIGIVGVALGTAIPHAVMTLVLLPAVVCGKLQLRIFRYFVGIYGRLALACIPIVVGSLLVRWYWPAHNLVEFFAQVALLCALYAGSVYAVALTREEKGLVMRLIPRRHRTGIA